MTECQDAIECDRHLMAEQVNVGIHERRCVPRTFASYRTGFSPRPNAICYDPGFTEEETEVQSVR